MKKLLLLTLIILLLCSCTSCSPPPENGFSAGSPGNAYEEAAKKYPGKTVLSWVFPFEAEGIDLNVVNNRLNELGKDYVLCFSPIEMGDGQTYTDKVLDYIAEGGPIDIVYSWLFYAQTDTGQNSYHRFIRKGIFEPIDSYLENTDTGRNLYSLMPDSYWTSLKAGGSIYGLSGNLSMLSPTRCLFVNAELAAKYGYDVSTPFSEQTEVVRKIIEGENCVGLFVSESCDAGFRIQEQLVEDFLYFDSSAQEFRCVTDNPDFRAALKSYFEMYRDGLLLTQSSLDDESWEKQPFAVEYSLNGSGKCLEDTVKVDVYDGNSYDMIPCIIAEPHLQAARTANGVCAASKHKDKAFDLLATVQTDEYLNNLLCFGSAELGDKPVSSFDDGNYTQFANKLICHPVNWLYVTTTPETARQALEGQAAPEAISFVFDPESVSEELKRLSMMMFYEFDDFLFSGSFSDFDEAMQAWQLELDNAGLQAVIDEANRQYKEGSAK